MYLYALVHFNAHPDIGRWCWSGREDIIAFPTVGTSPAELPIHLTTLFRQVCRWPVVRPVVTIGSVAVSSSITSLETR